MAAVQVRYIVNDVDPAIKFYCGQLGFKEIMHPSPYFAMLSKDELRLVLNKPGGGAGGGQAMSDGSFPEPGGWNRFAIEVPNIENEVEKLQNANVNFRSDIITGIGIKQCIIEDPSGNPVEIFQPIIPEAKLNPGS